MAYSNRIRYMFNDNFKILTWVLILFISITPNFLFMQSANAATFGGWTLGGGIAQGASTIYDATKTVIINGANVVKTSTVKITPVATDVAKVLARGAGGLALSVAVEQLLGAVDWVMDPANSQIKYYIETENPNTIQRIYETRLQRTYHVSISSAADATCLEMGWGKSISYSKDSSQSYSPYEQWTAKCEAYDKQYQFYLVNNPNYDPSAVNEREEKSLPLSTVAAQVISNAESDSDRKAGAQVATTAAAADIVNDAETDNTKASPIVTQLESAAQTATDETATGETTKPNTSDPTAPPEVTNISLEFPVFCGWAPVVCEAAQSAVNFMSDYDPAVESGDVQVNQHDNIIFDDSQRITFSSGCPAPEQFSVSFFGATQNLEFSYAPLCDFMSMIRPFVIAGSYLIGAYIVMGLSRGSAE